MHASRLLQVVRVPLLVGLLLAAGSPQQDLMRAFAQADLSAAWQPWLMLVVLAAAFVALALVGRERHHPAGVLVVEGLVAAVIGLIPPFLWILWFGVGPFVQATGTTTGNTLSQGLAVTWLVIVMATVVRQVRARRARSAVEDPSAERAG